MNNTVTMPKTIAFPAKMAHANRWGLWKRDIEVSGHINKIPWDPLHNQPGKSNDPITWCSYQQAREYYHQSPAAFGGPSFYLGDSWCLLDLDDITDTIAEHNLGEVNLIDQILFLLDDTYCEVSTSQSGLHFIFRMIP